MSKNIVILGAGESGTGAAILAKKQGFNVFVSDYSAIKEQYKSELNTHQILWEENQHTLGKILEADLIVKSPGIPESTPIVQALTKQETPILSEIEFAGLYSNSKMICITGSNGKTTTASLLYHIFKTGHKNVGLAGNIGDSLARQVAEKNHDYYIIELSSFQLDNMYQFKADTAILLNITPDHLDRYDYCMSKYINSKFRIIQNQTIKDYLIYWADDPILKEEVANRNIKSQIKTFSASHQAYTESKSNAIYIDNSITIDRKNLKLVGEHNLYNTMAAITAAHLNGIDKATIEEGLQTFTGVEHRLEFVASINNIEYINDSKATNVDSCWYALQAMKKPTVLILGGKDKGNDYNQIASLIELKCKGLVFLGKDNSTLEEFFKDYKLPKVSTNNMNDAVYSATNLAKSGDTILLSPCCASFDLFSSYENRGDLFKTSVKQL